MNNVEKLQKIDQSLQKLGLTPTEKQLDQFLTFYEALIEKNKVMNLTAITEFDEVVLKHFTDSLCIVKAIDLNQGPLKILDLGTGGGFPGIPIKIMFPDVEITLADSLNKRILFLQDVIAENGFRKIEAVHGRAEELARKPEYREQFDLCVSRAVANLSSLSEYCLPFVKVGGKMVSYKAGDVKEELEEAKKAIFLLGGKLKEEPIRFQLPDSEIDRTFILIDKTGKTSSKYPRKPGTPKKEPLK